MTAHESMDLLAKKEVTSQELTRAVIERIETVDKQVESYITNTFDYAMETAKAVDEKIAKGEALAPLEGVPMAIKDNICTKDITTTCASKMLENFVPPYDAFVAKKVKAAGAPMLGKLNMDEFAMGSSTENSYFKKTKNPYDLTRVPGGSSGGSAAAVSADLAMYTLGSDTAAQFASRRRFAALWA